MSHTPGAGIICSINRLTGMSKLHKEWCIHFSGNQRYTQTVGMM